MIGTTKFKRILGLIAATTWTVLGLVGAALGPTIRSRFVTRP